MMYVDVILGLVSSALVGIAGWLLTLGPRITAIEVKHAALALAIEDKLDALHKLTEIQFKAIDYRLSRIEGKMNGHLKD